MWRSSRLPRATYLATRWLLGWWIHHVVAPSKVEPERPRSEPPRVEPDAHHLPGLIAIVDDDAVTRRILHAMLTKAGFGVLEFATGTALLSRGTQGVGVACVDLGLDDMSGLDLIPRLRACDADVAIVVITGTRDLETAVQAMRAGAYDFLTKPFALEHVVPAIGRAHERWVLANRVHHLERAAVEPEMLPGLVGRSSAIRDLARQVDRVVGSDVSVCLFGESGTGKEVVAHAIHAKSSRHAGPFVALNCASIPATLQESELFGHERGAFTGAAQRHKGCFEQARGGTLFLDELGEMSPATQVSLLRALQERVIRRVGGTADIPVDVRIVCATHRDLRAEAEAGRFREDLYFRLVVYPIALPALRSRSDDVPLLIAYFMKKFASDAGTGSKRFAPEALEAMLAYPWPGNVRELQNVVHRTMLAADEEEVRLSDLPAEIRASAMPALSSREPPTPAIQPAPRSGARALLGDDEVISLVELERRAIENALRATKGNMGRAAKLLGLGRTTLYRRLAGLGMPLEETNEELCLAALLR
jgi:DNA-binding NtrC family response regulator